MPTPKQEYIRSLRAVARRYNRMERETIEQALAYLRAMRDRLQIELTATEGFNAFRIRELTAAVDDMVAQFEAQMVALSNGSIRQSARLGALSVVEPLQSAGLASGFFQPTPAQLNVFMDFSADLIRGIGRETLRIINREIRLAGMGERSTVSAMQAINRALGVSDGTGVAYEGERILRTELGRGYNLANFSQQQITAETVPDLSKQWLSARIPGRTRAAHWAAHNQIVLVNEPFIVGGEPLMYPLDPAGSAGNTINCLCRTVTVHPEIGMINVRLESRDRARA